MTNNEVEEILTEAISEEMALGGDAKSIASAVMDALRDDAPHILA